MGSTVSPEIETADGDAVGSKVGEEGVVAVDVFAETVDGEEGCDDGDCWFPGFVIHFAAIFGGEPSTTLQII